MSTAAPTTVANADDSRIPLWCCELNDSAAHESENQRQNQRRIDQAASDKSVLQQHRASSASNECKKDVASLKIWLEADTYSANGSRKADAHAAVNAPDAIRSQNVG